MLGFGKKYKVDYNGQKEWFTLAKDSYTAGERVRLCYGPIATDTNYNFYLDGEQINPDYSEGEGFVIEFTMPERDVSVNVTEKNTMLFEPEIKSEAVLTFDSFDGGGPSYSVKTEDETVASCRQRSEYLNPDHEQMCGSGYTVYITFTALKEGKTTATVECRSPIAENYDAIYDIEVTAELGITLTQREIKEFNG